MTLEEAIEMLSGYVYEEKPCPVGLFDEATKLLIEAGKLIQLLRSKGPVGLPTLLPGETK